MKYYLEDDGTVYQVDDDDNVSCIRTGDFCNLRCRKYNKGVGCADCFSDAKDTDDIKEIDGEDTLFLEMI